MIRHQDMQVGVQYQHGFRHGFDDGLGKLARKYQFLIALLDDIDIQED